MSGLKNSSKLREALFFQVSQHPRRLSEEHMEALQSPEVQALITLLHGEKRHWMPAEEYKPQPRPPQEVASSH